MADDPRFLTLADVAEVLNTSGAQVYALVRRGELPAIKIGGRGQWRVERVQLEEFIQRMYAETRTFVDQHPFVDAEPGRPTTRRVGVPRRQPTLPSSSTSHDPLLAAADHLTSRRCRRAGGCGWPRSGRSRR